METDRIRESTCAHVCVCVRERWRERERERDRERERERRRRGRIFKTDLKRERFKNSPLVSET